MLLVTHAKHLGSHMLEIEFSDGQSRILDFSLFIYAAGHPDYAKYKNPDHFENFKIEDGNLVWDDYAMIFPVEDLYAGTLSKK